MVNVAGVVPVSGSVTVMASTEMAGAAGAAVAITMRKASVLVNGSDAGHGAEAVPHVESNAPDVTGKPSLASPAIETSPVGLTARTFGCALSGRPNTNSVVPDAASLTSSGTNAAGSAPIRNASWVAASTASFEGDKVEMNTGRLTS